MCHNIVEWTLLIYVIINEDLHDCTQERTLLESNWTCLSWHYLRRHPNGYVITLVKMTCLKAYKII